MEVVLSGGTAWQTVTDSNGPNRTLCGEDGNDFNLYTKAC